MSGASKEKRARSFGDVAGEYERGRPGYAPEVIEWLLGSEPREVLDIGAGTGKLTRAIVDAGHSVTAVEPLEPMRAILQRSVPEAHALAGTAEELPLGAASVDAVLVGSAFHWFDADRALAECVRVLRPAGVLGLLGNTFDTSVPWVGRLRGLLGPPPADRPGHWPDEARLRALFAEVEDRNFAHDQTVDVARLRDLAISRSNIAVLPEHEREVELARLERLWSRDPELAGRRTVILPWLTRARRCAGLRSRPA